MRKLKRKPMSLTFRFFFQTKFFKSATFSFFCDETKIGRKISEASKIFVPLAGEKQEEVVFLEICRNNLQLRLSLRLGLSWKAKREEKSNCWSDLRRRKSERERVCERESKVKGRPCACAKCASVGEGFVSVFVCFSVRACESNGVSVYVIKFGSVRQCV